MEWIMIATAVALASLTLTILLDMAARAFGLQQLSLWVKSEYAQVAVSFLIIAFAAAMASAGTSMLKEVTAEVASAAGNNALTQIAAESADPFAIAKSYILDPLIACQKNAYFVIMGLNMFFEPVSTLSFEILSVEALGGGFAFGGFTSLFHYLDNGIVYLAIFNYVQYYLLTFCQYTMLPVFLPIGLVLRAFPVTRGAGGLITAFALGFAFVYPMTYVLIIALMSNIDAPCAQVTALAPKITADPCFNNRGAVQEIVFELGGKTGETNKFSDSAIGLLSIMYMQAFFYPLIALIVTFTFIRQTGSLFGADLAEIGRGIIKII